MSYLDFPVEELFFDDDSQAGIWINRQYRVAIVGHEPTHANCLVLGGDSGQELIREAESCEETAYGIVRDWLSNQG